MDRAAGGAEMNEEQLTANPPDDARRMTLRYGFNEIYGWWHSSRGKQSEEVRRHLRLMDTKVMRIFAFDQPVPSPVREWGLFAAYVQGVLDAGAVPMITLAKFPAPYDKPEHIRDFVSRCSDLVWNCLEQWGGEAVKDWYWCIWNEPNNLIVGGDLTFEQYRTIYQEVAAAIIPLLEPHLAGRKALIGGPAIDSTHRLYWLDWIARLITEVDDRMVSFVSWHRYGDWRPAVPSASLALEMWGSPDAPTGERFEQLLMAQTPVYEAHARSVARLLKGRGIANFCGELNAISHHEQYYTLGLNQNAFGGAYYASALINLIRGGAELEMRWTATAHETDAYGLIGMDGVPMAAGRAKQIFAQHVRFGDGVRFPAAPAGAAEAEAIVAWDAAGRRSGVFVNTSARPIELRPCDWDAGLSACTRLLRVDAGTKGRIARQPFDGTVRIEGYGVAAITTAADTGED
jgi:Glycosyl hydrolases family 39